MNGIVENSRLENALKGMKGWLKLLGILIIISGVPNVLVLIGILQIWLGVVLFQAGSRAEQFLVSKSSDDLAEFASKLKTFFVVNGVLALIGIIFALLGLCAWIVMIIMGVGMSGMENFS